MMAPGPIPRAVAFIFSLLHVWPVLPWSATLDHLAYDTIKSTNAHTALPMSCECMMPREAVAAFAWVWLDARVDLGMALEVVLAHEALLAGWTLILPVVEVRLYVTLDVFLAAKPFPTVFVCAYPFAVCGIGTFDVLGDVVQSYPSVCLGLFDVDTSNAGSAGNGGDRVRSSVRRTTARRGN